MKFLWIILLPAAILAQISKIEITKPERTIAKYDSTQNYMYENPAAYIGQTLYLKPLPKQLQEYGYQYFKTAINGHASKWVYKRSHNGIDSDYTALAEKYFLVIDVVQGDYFDYLKLVNIENDDTVYFRYSPIYKTSFPFLVVGFVDKTKKENIGKQFIIKGALAFNPDATFDIWTCIDVSVDSENGNLVLVLNNEKKDQHFVQIGNTGYSNDIMPLVLAEHYQKEYGHHFNVAITGKIQLGMPKAMCRIAFGDPEKINPTITANSISEQWVYVNNYLYFENGILTAIQ